MKNGELHICGFPSLFPISESGVMLISHQERNRHLWGRLVVLWFAGMGTGHSWGGLGLSSPTRTTTKMFLLFPFHFLPIHRGKNVNQNLVHFKFVSTISSLNFWHLWHLFTGKNLQAVKRSKVTPVFIAALFTIARTWKQPKCPSTEEWIKKMWYIYAMEYYSAIKKERNNAICSNMDGPRDCHTEWSKSDKDKYHMILLICGILKNGTNEPIYKTEIESQM